MRIPGLQIALVPDSPGVGVIALSGPIDAGNVRALQVLLSTSAGRALRSVILDLGQARYINSMGMSYLVSLSDLLETRGGALCLANPEPKVKVVLEMMGLTELFKLHASISGAIRAIRNGKQPVGSEPRRRIGRSKFSAAP
jgi:anti-anti-sigma factor